MKNPQMKITEFLPENLPVPILTIDDFGDPQFQK